ncbi:MAG TPA: N-6 DNA methylase [Rhodanobacteraceae bacterium]|nr:N-6 DNA methylase [Rhodanobacteraceae bacterium]
MARTASNGKSHRAIGSTQSLTAFVKGVCDIMRRSNCASALQYVSELTWILFLRILDAQESRARLEAEAQGRAFTAVLRAPYRWKDWAAPFRDGDDALHTPEGQPFGWKRHVLSARVGDLIAFINGDLLPQLHTLDLLPDGRPDPAATPRRRVIARIMTAVECVRVDDEANLADILDRIDEINIDRIDDTHFFTLSQAYEGLLLKMGEKNSGGQFFTPREVIRAMVRTVAPHPGDVVYDPCCGTGGFLAQAYEAMLRELGVHASATALERLKRETFYGREKDNLAFPIALANLVLHGIDQPNIWHGNTLTRVSVYDGLFAGAPETFDVVLTNPPFGGKEGASARWNFPFQTGATQVLFLQHVLDSLRPAQDGRPGGTCGMVLDEGLLFRTNEGAFVETKRRLLNECALWCVVSLPGGVFSTAGAGVKTNLLFFTKGVATTRIWYYDLSHVKVGKKSPLTLAHFGWGSDGQVLDDAALPESLVGEWRARDGDAGAPFPSFARLLAKRGAPEGESDCSWTVDFAARRVGARKAMQPHLDEAAARREELVRLKEEYARLRRGRAGDAALAASRELQSRAEHAARDAQAKADAIDAACFDLKAVNPRAVDTRDTRTPETILDSIAAHGETMRQALGALRGMLRDQGAGA